MSLIKTIPKLVMYLFLSILGGILLSYASKPETNFGVKILLSIIVFGGLFYFSIKDQWRNSKKLNLTK